MLRHERDDLFRRRWFDVPVPLGLFRFHQFAVASESYAAVVMSDFQGGRGSGLEVRPMIAALRESCRIIRHLGSGIRNANHKRSGELLRTFCLGKYFAQSEAAIIISPARTRAIRGNPANGLTRRSSCAAAGWRAPPAHSVRGVALAGGLAAPRAPCPVTTCQIPLRSVPSDFNDCHIPASSPDEFPRQRSRE